MISGIDGVTVSMRSKRNVIIEGPEGEIATIRPFMSSSSYSEVKSGHTWLFQTQVKKAKACAATWLLGIQDLIQKNSPKPFPSCLLDVEISGIPAPRL
ncbi:hypothetical protein EK904_006238 [Melospiza melodia maxima]|nr:hypothetical protein EK904_006238 [Melospiza melodia maxima]